jgi:riboflavin transporter FmnP
MKYIKHAAIAIIFTSIVIYFFTPTINYGFKDLPNVLLPLCIGYFVWELKKLDRIKKIRVSMSSIIFGGMGILVVSQFPTVLFFILIAYLFWERMKFKKDERIRFSRNIILVVLAYSVALPFFTSSVVFKSNDYRDLIGEVKTGEDFTSKISPISNNEIRVVDKDIAYRLGDKVLGAVPAMGSQVEIGDFSIQSVNGKLYWVAPLLHSGYFKWSKNSKGTAGYIKVSATNERDVELVQTYGEENVLIKYQPQAYFSDNLERHIYFNGYMTKGYTDYSFEIDNNGKPYWVVTLYKKRIGFSGKDAIGVLVVDCKTGDMKEYTIADAPEWIDRIQPSYFIQDQLDYWGEYVQGYVNFADENKLTTTSGISLVYGEGNKSYWYTGLTSVGADEGTVGFVLVDTRTKEATWYKQVGATEEAAQSSAEGKVQEKRYNASFPITYNVNGIPTYVMSLKDEAGLVKMLAMVSVEDYTIVGVGNDFNEALRAYKNALNSTSGETVVSYSADKQTIRQKVLRIAPDVKNGNTTYYILLSNFENKLFVGSSAISIEMPITTAGDSVIISFDNDNNRLIDIASFDNLELK